jgi:hypothetical protein
MIATSSFFVGIGFLIVLSILDFLTYNKKHGFIPSAMTTLFLIVALLLGIANPIQTLFIGAFAGLMSLLFTDLDLWGGVADLKIFIASAMLFPHIVGSVTFALILTILAFIIKSIVVWKLNKNQKIGYIPFIPIILLAFLGAWALI